MGVNATPSFNPADRHWQRLVDRGGPAWVAALDYVGLDFFPDVFRPLPTPDFRTAVEEVVGHFRASLSAVGIPARVTIRITENGWPTGRAGRRSDRPRSWRRSSARSTTSARGSTSPTASSSPFATPWAALRTA